MTEIDVGPDATGAAHGLSLDEVERRTRAGEVNHVPGRTSRSYRGIVRSNVLTRFNLIISVLTAVVLVFGEPADALFAIVMIVNSTIGILQEARAKRTLDRLQVLVAPVVTVRRQGEETAILPEHVVLGDVLVLHPGDQVPVDGRICGRGMLEVDESALTGEADPIVRTTGDGVLSGSVVMAGSAVVTATRVGTDAWIHQLVTQAKEYAPATSELRVGVDRILQIVGWAIAPLAVLLVWSQLRSEQSTPEAMVAAVAGVVGLVPQGLVLLVSMALAVAIIRLARQHVVVQELHAVEGLARIDVFCVDKTGTLTTGHMRVSSIEPVACDADTVAGVLASLGTGTGGTTNTLRVIADHVAGAAIWPTEHEVPFSAHRKWSGATFAVPSTDGPVDRTWVLGAPEILLDRVSAADSSRLVRIVDAAAADAGRVVLLASTSETLSTAELPPELTARAVIVLVEEIRPDVAETLDFFTRQGVVVKVISGDNPTTVSAIAARLGLCDADSAVDMRAVDTTDEASLRELVGRTAVFGRVDPDQKRSIVDALQRAGHTVAMTGDGVNDIPALKRADIGVAVDSATPATKAIAQLVLLDGRFDRMPHVVAEGRRVIANMERVSSLFVTKTVYSALFALTIGVSGAVFPFLPRQMSLVSELTIGLPAFVLSFRAAGEPSRPGYLHRVFRFAIPAGTAAAAITIAAYWTARSPFGQSDLAQARTVSTIALIVVAFWVLFVLVQPVDAIDVAVLATVIALFVIALAVAPIRRFYRLDWPPIGGIVATALIVGAGVLAAQIALTMTRRRRALR